MALNWKRILIAILVIYLVLGVILVIAFRA